MVQVYLYVPGLLNSNENVSFWSRAGGAEYAVEVLSGDGRPARDGERHRREHEILDGDVTVSTGSRGRARKNDRERQTDEQRY